MRKVALRMDRCLHLPVFSQGQIKMGDGLVDKIRSSGRSTVGEAVRNTGL